MQFRLRVVAASSLIALIALSVVWELWLAPLKPGGSLMALKALPLAMPQVLEQRFRSALSQEI